MKEKFIEFIIIALTAIFSASMVYGDSLYPSFEYKVDSSLKFDTISNMLVVQENAYSPNEGLTVSNENEDEEIFDIHIFILYCIDFLVIVAWFLFIVVILIIFGILTIVLVKIVKKFGY